MYLYVSFFNENDLLSGQYDLYGKYVKAIKETFPSYGELDATLVEGCIGYLKGKGNASKNCYLINIRGIDAEDTSFHLDFEILQELDISNDEINKSLYRFARRADWIDNRTGFFPLVCIVNKLDFDTIRKGISNSEKVSSYSAELEELKRKNDWQGICNKFSPLDKIEANEEVWNNPGDLYDLGLACSKMGELKNGLERDKEHLKYIKEYREYSIDFYKRCCQYRGDDTIEDLLNRLPPKFIKHTIDILHSAYKQNKKVDYDNFHLPYLLYYLPANVFKIWKPLLELHLRNTLKPSMRILDVGTGPGSIPVGIIEFYGALARNHSNIHMGLSFVLIEKEKEFIDITMETIGLLKAKVPPNLSVEIEKVYNHRVTENYQNAQLGKFDMIVMSNFLAINEENNNKNAGNIVKEFGNYLEDNGSLVVIEPGDQANCIALKSNRNRLVNNAGFTLFSPCIGIWEEKEYYNCACFNTTRIYWELPEIYKFLIKNDLGKGNREYVPFNYIILRRDGLKKYEVVKNTQYFTKLDELQENIGEIVNVIALVRSFRIAKGMAYFYLCDGSCSFGGANGDIRINISSEELIRMGIDVPIISSERIKIKRVLVKQVGRDIVLELGENTTMVVEY